MEFIVRRLMENHRLDEMAMERSDAIDRCISLGNNFIEHFDEIYKESDQAVVSHWCDEMNAWLKEVKDIALKPKAKQITFTQLVDWFFTAGSSTEIKFSDSEEEHLYNEFIRIAYQCTDVREAFLEVGISTYEVLYKNEENKSHKRRRR